MCKSLKTNLSTLAKNQKTKILNLPLSFPHVAMQINGFGYSFFNFLIVSTNRLQTPFLSKLQAEVSWGVKT